MSEEGEMETTAAEKLADATLGGVSKDDLIHEIDAAMRRAQENAVEQACVYMRMLADDQPELGEVMHQVSMRLLSGAWKAPAVQAAWAAMKREAAGRVVKPKGKRLVLPGDQQGCPGGRAVEE